MAAWKDTAAWNNGLKDAYRNFVRASAPDKWGSKGLDCADLSNSMLIDFAYSHSLPLTFVDNDGKKYSSWAKGESPYREIGSWRWGKEWSNKEEYWEAVRDRIGTAAMFKRNTEAKRGDIEPGDLMIAYEAVSTPWGEVASTHHTALVYRVFKPGEHHPYEKSQGVPDFPGGEEAIKQTHQWEYFRGTIQGSKDGKPIINRAPTKDVHINYLNYRSKRKDRAELIYFANARQLTEEDKMQFRWYADSVFS
jgi:hypothetical protein